MLLLPASELPDDDAWRYEVKLDGYRAVAFKTGGHVQLRSRNDSDFTRRYSAVSAALRNLPDESVIDGEIVALDADGRPSFNLLQNHGRAKSSSEPLARAAAASIYLMGLQSGRHTMLRQKTRPDGA
jgi:bifunctional non-homologous end joining protein LigD